MSNPTKENPLKSTAFFATLACLLSLNAQATNYTDRAAFDAALGASVTDTYENPAYGTSTLNFLSDQAMSAVLGETRYQSTSFTNSDIVFAVNGNSNYCAGCNGGFRLDFSATSVGSAAGVYGVGFDITYTSGALSALLTYGDGSTASLAIPLLATAAPQFYGFSSDHLISSIAFLVPAQPFSYLAIDNLTIGNAASAVPEPGMATMLLLGLGALAAQALLARRRRQPA